MSYWKMSATWPMPRWLMSASPFDATMPAEQGDRHVLAPRQVAQPAQMAAPERHHHAGLALPEEQRVGTHAALEGDACAQARAPERALGEGDRQPPFRHVVRRAQQTLG